MKYEIKNWSQFQQYKDDRPLKWIKFHSSLLDDYSFNHLPESAQLQLLKLWLVASKTGGKLEGDAKWFAIQSHLKKVDLDILIREGFITRTEVSIDPYEIVPRVEESREELEKRKEEERKEEERKRIVELKRDQAIDIFKFWQETMGHPKAAYDNKRKALITPWLDHYSIEDCKKAIHGCSVTPYNMGDNPQGSVYDSFELIFRDSKHIDDYMRNSDKPPAGKVTTIQQSVDKYAAQTARIQAHMEKNK